MPTWWRGRQGESVSDATKPLEFDDVDGLAFAAARGRLGKAVAVPAYKAGRLGPLVELLHLAAGDRLPNPAEWLASCSGCSALASAVEANVECWVSPEEARTGVFRTVGPESTRQPLWTGFLMKAKRAGREVSGLPRATSGQLVGAMEELENNVHEHSEATDTGIVAYNAAPGIFEFVVADRGIGILESLRRCTDHSGLVDEGAALEAALTDGVSRYGEGCRRGYGFRPIFTGLVSLFGELRFRSGDHAITMHGTGPNVSTARIAQKAPIDGFLASVACHARTVKDNR